MKKHLVMLHGFGTDSRIFASVGHKLSKDYDVILVDIPGHGQTKEHFTDFSFAAYTISHALDHHLGEPYDLLGWSMGGQIALEMYRQQLKLNKMEQKKHKCDDPACHAYRQAGGHDHGSDETRKGSISSLILVSTTPKFVSSDDFPAGMNKAVFSKFKRNIKENSEKGLEDFYGLMFNKNETGPELLEEIVKQRPSDDTLNACMQNFEDKDERGVLPQITIPTLIIAGDEDKIIDPKASLYMSQEIKGSIIKIFKGTGHTPFVPMEKEFVKEVSEFLG